MLAGHFKSKQHGKKQINAVVIREENNFLLLKIHLRKCQLIETLSELEADICPA